MMNSIKPRINLAGYKKALQEYGQNPSRIVEELVTNSYDADATVVVVLHSTRDIIVIDDGTAFQKSSSRNYSILELARKSTAMNLTSSEAT